MLQQSQFPSVIAILDAIHDFNDIHVFKTNVHVKDHGNDGILIAQIHCTIEHSFRIEPLTYGPVLPQYCQLF
jgi:hypothetical protein